MTYHEKKDMYDKMIWFDSTTFATLSFDAIIGTGTSSMNEFKADASLQMLLDGINILWSREDFERAVKYNTTFVSSMIKDSIDAWPELARRMTTQYIVSLLDTTKHNQLECLWYVMNRLVQHIYSSNYKELWLSHTLLVKDIQYKLPQNQKKEELKNIGIDVLSHPRTLKVAWEKYKERLS